MTEEELTSRLEKIRDIVIDVTVDNTMDVVVRKVADACKREIERYWRMEETMRDIGEHINDLNMKMSGIAYAYVGVFDALGCEFDFKIDWFDAECRFHKFTVRRKDDNSVVLSMQNFGKDEWWA